MTIACLGGEGVSGYDVPFDLGAAKPTEVAVEHSRRDQRIAVFETIGCALATLRRLDHVWYDGDIHETITKVRASLSVAQSKIKERIEPA